MAGCSTAHKPLPLHVSRWEQYSGLISKLLEQDGGALIRIFWLHFYMVGGAGGSHLCLGQCHLSVFELKLSERTDRVQAAVNHNCSEAEEEERNLQDAQDKLDGLISRKHFEQTVAGQDDEPADRQTGL